MKPIKRALSIRQPWASLIVRGIKDIENRSWPTKFRGPFAVHASKTFDRQAPDWINNRFNLGISKDENEYATCGIVGTAYLNNCIETSDSPWFTGPFGFVIRQAHEIPYIPAAGHLRFFQLPETAAKTINKTRIQQ